MGTITVIETREVEREYGFRGTEAIIDHPKYGRLLISDGFGGMSELRGGMVRWEDGYAMRLLEGDTFESMEDEDWNEGTSLYAAATNGYDERRPVMGWPGARIARLAKTAGL